MNEAERTTYRRWMAGAVAASVVLRLRFLATPLSVDEAGALVAARSWAGGGRLYADVFIDRPQGVIGLFRGWDALAGGLPSSVRLVAIVAGVLTVIGVGSATRAVSGSWRAGAAAAWLVAVISASAAFEGYAANGELLAGGLSVPAMAIGALVITGRITGRWILVAGILATGAITMKQSGLDVLVALAAWLALAAVLRWIPRRRALELLGLLVTGAAIVALAVLTHGASLGWDRYWYALYGFRAQSRSGLADPQFTRLGITLAVALALLGPATVLAVRHLRAQPPPVLARIRPPHALLLVWLGSALGGFLIGGNYHRHYWIALTFPIAALAGLSLTVGVGTWASLRRSLAWALALPLAISIVLIAAPGIERDRRVDADVALGRWYRDQRTAPTDVLLPLCGSATAYVETDQVPPYRYIWVDHVRDGRDATAELVDLLDGPERPRFLALHQPLSECDPTGQIRAVVAERYEQVATIDGVGVLQAR